MKHCGIAIFLGGFCMISYAQAPDPDVDDRQADREEWFYNQRAFPTGQIPTGARIQALAEIQRIDRAARLRRPAANATGNQAAALDAASWTSIGPRPTGLGSGAATSGRVNAVAVDPRDNNTVYIGAAEGGVWKTTDGGTTWRPLTDDQASLASGAIALDPSNPDVVYVGTGEENFAQDSYYGAGILKSTDAGATWTNLVGPFLRDRIGALTVHPSNGQVLLVASSKGIWRSSDGAAIWKLTLPGTGTGVVFDPTNGDIAYAALGNTFGDSSNGVFRSTDGGKTWQSALDTATNALPNPNIGRVEIAIAPSTPTTLYAGIQDSITNDLLGIFKTTDGGANWSSTGAPDLCPSPVEQCWYDLTIRVHPKNPDIVFAGGSLSFAKTLNGGATWSQFQLPFPSDNGVLVHVDWHNLALTPDGTKLYVANDGGVYSTTDITPFNMRFTELNDTLALTQFYPGLSIHPDDPGITFAGAQDNGTQQYTGGPGWNEVTCGDGGFTAIDPVLPSVVFAACQRIEILRAADGGARFVTSEYGIDSSDRVSFIAPLVMDPANSQTLYFGTYRVWQTRDGGGQWSAISPDITGDAKATIRAVAVAPSDDNTVYAGSSDVSRVSAHSSTTKIRVSHNAIGRAAPSWTDRSSGLPPRVVTAIVVDPIDSGTAYATFSGFASGADRQGHVFRTIDSGASWLDISGNLPNLPVNDLVVDPDLPDTLYIGTDAGVMATTDEGATWSSLGNGLPRVVVHSLVLHRPSRTLRAATHGRSVWDLLVPLAAGSLQPTIASLSPDAADAGAAAFTLAVTGSNFGAGTVLRWNGQTRQTTVADTSHLTAQIPASDVALVGRISIDVFNASAGGGASKPKLFTIGPAPETSAAAFVSAASPASGSALAPRSIASLYGANLSGVTSAAGPAPLPSVLGGTTVEIFGVAAPLFFVSPGQINLQVPFVGIPLPAQVPLKVTQGSFSTTISVELTPYSPALFTTNSQGTGQASALISGTASIAAKAGVFVGSRPAQRGESVSLYCTGLGDVTHRPPLGSPSPSDPLARTLAIPTVTVGGVPALVSFSGLAPGYVGLYQVNLQVPSNAPAGDAVPVILKIGGVTSNTATIAIE
jgi:uncharacterized protein (TIGR03437 family)